VPTTTQRDNHPQHPLLRAVRDSQTAFLDVVRSWTDLTQHLTRHGALPMAGIDLAGAVDRSFDLAAQTLATQRQLARTLVGAVERQVDTALETVDSSAHQRLGAVEGRRRDANDHQPQPTGRDRSEPPTPANTQAPTDPTRTQDPTPDRRGFAERSLQELRDRARELEIDGRSSMSKDELIAALRQHAK
jgi:Rho termination factor, N-terminal domain